MKQITREQIDKVVNKKFEEMAGDIIVQYAENLNMYVEATKDENKVIKDNTVYLAAIKTAQDNCMMILKESLKELLCD